MRVALPVLLLPALASPALASSEEAWEAFRTAVGAACAALVQLPGEAELTIEVNPFGSEHYGAAVVVTTLPDGSADRQICIYNKANGAAELTAPYGVNR